MRNDLSHLPERKKRELDVLLKALFEEFEKEETEGKILAVILFGSYARGDWVEDHVSGYYSDYDILVIVDNEELAGVEGFFTRTEWRLIQDPNYKTVANIICHSLEDVNKNLQEGQYFFTDIKDDGIALYRVKGLRFKKGKPKTPDDAFKIAKRYYDQWMPTTERLFQTFEYQLNNSWLNESAFTLHQAAERAYHCLLLVTTYYSPATHNLSFLRSLTEHKHGPMRNIWPNDSQRARRAFSRLKRAYVEARYSEHYEVTKEELEWLGKRVEHLHKTVREICEARLRELEDAIER